MKGYTIHKVPTCINLGFLYFRWDIDSNYNVTSFMNNFSSDIIIDLLSIIRIYC